ncbi:MAG: lipoyl synthase [Candidatus Nitrospinota bacterium M3_3B_026]
MIKPEWLRKPRAPFMETAATRAALRGGVNTVCAEARCPNMGECYSAGTATFMILGAVCSRRCGFCAVDGGRPGEVDAAEPGRVAAAAARLGLAHVVITSVTRDDLPDGGASVFAKTIAALREKLPTAAVEVLTPDFRGREDAILAVADTGPDVYNHNVETVPALYGRVRPGADYAGSLRLLRLVKERAPSMATKSGIMLGLGETMGQVAEVMADLRGAGCDILTIGQYLRPTLASLPVAEYVPPAIFEQLERQGRDMGFRRVFAGPFVRSSYHAAEVFAGSRMEGARPGPTPA